MAIEIVDLPMKHGDFPLFFVCLPGRVLEHITYQASDQSPGAPTRRLWLVTKDGSHCSHLKIPGCMAMIKHN